MQITLLPDRVKAAWERCDKKEITYEQFQAIEALEIRRYQKLWTEALILSEYTDLYESLLTEIWDYTGLPIEEIRSWCDQAVEKIARSWELSRPQGREQIEKWYDSALYIYELMAWHSLRNDNTPLAYVGALEFAKRVGIKNHFDFGSGVGSGTILFHRHGIQSWMGDISTLLLEFARKRAVKRGCLNSTIWTGLEGIWPYLKNQFDFITAMEVFEHLYDPIQTLENLHGALVSGGYLFIQLSSCRPDPERPQHIVTDPQPIFKRLSELGMVKVWSDGWVWGHDCFQKQ